MNRSFTAMRKLIVVSAVVAAPVLSAGCTNCDSGKKAKAKSACATPAVACPTPQVVYAARAAYAAPAYSATPPTNMPVCDGGVAFDGSVIQNGTVVHNGAYANRAAAGLPPYPAYAQAVYQEGPYNPANPAFQATPVGRAVAPARPAQAKAPVVARAAAEKPAKPRRNARPAAPRAAPEVVVVPGGVASTAIVTDTGAIVPNAVGAQDVTMLARVSEPYTVKPGQTYSIAVDESAGFVLYNPAETAAPAQAPAGAVLVPAPVLGDVYTDPVEAARAASNTGRVLGPSTMGLTDAELDNYSRVDVYEAPPQPAPVPPPVIPGAGSCAPELVNRGLCPNP